jgi:hypothetical protein
MKADFAINSNLIMRSTQTVQARSASVTLFPENNAAEYHVHQKETRKLLGRIGKRLDQIDQKLVLASRKD